MVADLDDYVKYSPSIAYSRAEGQGGNGQPGTSHIYMRGVTSGANENHSGSQPSVGTYLDEQPVTTIDGTVDVHLYDIQRDRGCSRAPRAPCTGQVRRRAPSASSPTSRTRPTQAGYDMFSGDKIMHGGVNRLRSRRLSWSTYRCRPIAAVRLVGWDEHDPGYINNVAGTEPKRLHHQRHPYLSLWHRPARRYLVREIACSNAGSYVKKNYNTSEYKGPRAALKLELTATDWTVTPAFTGQQTAATGFFGYDPAVGALELVHFGPENDQDSFTQSALTVEGK